MEVLFCGGLTLKSHHSFTHILKGITHTGFINMGHAALAQF